MQKHPRTSKVMWTFDRSKGRISYTDGQDYTAYSGFGDGKNNVQMQDVQNVGPIPAGSYTILFPRTTVSHGPYVLPLVPDPANEMFGRSGFLIHGDSIENPGTASHGCVIVARSVREAIWSSNDHRLTVI